MPLCAPKRHKNLTDTQHNACARASGKFVDRINARYGKATVHVASTGHTQEDEAGWRMRQERRTPRYTTQQGEIPIARA